MKSVSKVKVLNVMLFCSITLTNCQNHSKKQENLSQESTFTKQVLLEDFKVFRESLEEMHPGLYMYKSIKEMDDIFNIALKSISEDMSEFEYTKILKRVAAQIGDGHLGVLPPIDKVRASFSEANLFPFSVTYRKGAFYIKEDYSESPIKDFVGAKIHSINGHSMEDFIDEFLLLSTADGSNKTYKYRYFASPSYFSSAFNIVYGKQESYGLKYTPMSSKKEMSVTIDLQTNAQQKGISKNRYPKTEKETAPVNFYLSEDNKYAVLKITTFDSGTINDSGIQFNSFLKDAFIEMKNNNVENLILDVRYNGGGDDDLGKMLFSFFTDKDFMYYKSLTINNTQFEYMKYTRNPTFKMSSSSVKANDKGTYDVINHPNIGLQSPSFPIFKGKVFILINGGSFSTTSEFLSMMHYHTEAVFIGEESGGGYYGNNSGFTPFVNLPNTKIITAIPMFAYRMAVESYPHKDRGIIPDYKVQPTIEDELNNNDVEFNLAKELIYNN